LRNREQLQPLSLSPQLFFSLGRYPHRRASNGIESQTNGEGVTVKQFELTFEGLLNDSADALRRIKSILVAELNLEIPKVQEILEAPPQVIMTSWDESELRAYLEKLEMAGALVHLTSDEESGPQETSEEEYELSFDLEDFSTSEPAEPKVWSLELEDNSSEEEEIAELSSGEEEITEVFLSEEKPLPFTLSLDEDEGHNDVVSSLDPSSVDEEDNSLAFAPHSEIESPLPLVEPFDLSLTLDDEPLQKSAPQKVPEQIEAFSLSLGEDPAAPPLGNQSKTEEHSDSNTFSLALSLEEEELPITPPEVRKPETSVIHEAVTIPPTLGVEDPPSPSVETAQREPARIETPPPLPQLEAPHTSSQPTPSQINAGESQLEDKVSEIQKRPSRFASLAIEAPPLVSLEETEDESSITPKGTATRSLRFILGIGLSLLVGANYYYFSSLEPSHDPLHGLSYDDLLKSPRTTEPKVAVATSVPTPLPPLPSTHVYEGTLQGATYNLAISCDGDEKRIQACSGTLTTVKPRDPRPEEIVQGIIRAPWAERLEIGPLLFSYNSDGTGDGDGPTRIYVDYKGGRERIVGRALAKVSAEEKPLLSLLMTNARSGENEAPNSPQLEYSQGGYHFRFAERIALNRREKDGGKRGDAEASPPSSSSN